MFTDDAILHVENLKDLQKSKARPPFLLIYFALKKLISIKMFICKFIIIFNELFF